MRLLFQNGFVLVSVQQVMEYYEPYLVYVIVQVAVI